MSESDIMGMDAQDFNPDEFSHPIDDELKEK
jgi:hypothetical protein